MSNRRDFIKNSSSIIGAGALASNLILDQDSSKLIDTNVPNDIIGQGDFQYRLDKNWGVPTTGHYPVHHCHEMVMDKKGRLIMTTTQMDNNVLIYNKDGVILDTWTGHWPGAHGLAICDEGGREYLYITDPDISKVFKTDLSGKVLMTISYPKEANIYEVESDFKPTETAVADNGDIYVADGYGLSYIIVYDSNGKYKSHFGGKGEGSEHFDCPHGITIDTRKGRAGELLITSRSANEFKRFTMDGQHIETIKMPGYFMCRPVIRGEYLYFAILATETWWAYDGMVAVLDNQNKLVSLPGSKMLPSYSDGIVDKPNYDNTSFLNPHDVCVDHDGNIYVPQWYSGKTYPYRLERV